MSDFWTEYRTPPIYDFTGQRLSAQREDSADLADAMKAQGSTGNAAEPPSEDEED